MSSAASSTSILSTESVAGRRQRQRRENYKAGMARSAYKFQKSLERSFRRDSLTSSTPAGCRRYCTLALEDLKEPFAAISKHPAKVLQNRMASYPTPKKPRIAHQNFTAQNRWLRENVLDGNGNYLFCQECIIASLGVHSQRLHRQRSIKQLQKTQPVVTMTKAEVEEKKLETFVLHDDEEIQTFSVWWKSLSNEEEVEVQYPHERHGLAGRVSNSAKTDAMNDFLAFVDANSQPNGRQLGSYSAQFFFHPKFTRIAPPRVGEKNYEEKCHSSLVFEFCRAQRELGRSVCGPTAACDWLKMHRPKVTLHPSMTDYCDTCKHLNEQLSRIQAITNRLHQSGNATEGELKHYEELKKKVEEERYQHREDASKSREYYKFCKDQCMQKWKKILDLSDKTHLIQTEKDELHSLKHCFTLTISADYQQSKLIPTWGKSEQPGSTYYLQKVSHDIFGIVDHRDEKGFIYLFDERIGPKNTDHTISLLMEYWKIESTKYPWIQRLAIFLDNATSTNKNRYLFGWATEMVNSGKISHIHISFMIAGHTKFAPDRLFATIGSAFKVADTFNIDELQALCSSSAETYIENGENVLIWRDTLTHKYSDLPGVRKYHDFLFIRSHTGQVVMKVRKQCYTGSWINSPLHLIDESICGMPSSNYKETKIHNIKDDKMAHMVTMYNKFVSPDRRPSYLPPIQPLLLSTVVHPPTQEPSPAPSCGRNHRPRKTSACTIEGCDGSGHRNKARWAEGHTTRAGCPIFHAKT